MEKKREKLGLGTLVRQTRNDGLGYSSPHYVLTESNISGP